MANKSKDTKATPADTRRKVFEGAFKQILDEGKMTLDGVMARSGVGGRQTVVNYMDEAREEARNRIRFLVELSEKQDFPLEAIFVQKDWAMAASERMMQDERDALSKARDAFETEREDIRAEQTRLKDEVRDLQHVLAAVKLESDSNQGSFNTRSTP